MAKNMEFERSFMQCIFPVQRILWQRGEKATNEKEARGNRENVAYKKILPSLFSASLSFVHFKAERKISHFVMNEIGNVENLRDAFMEHENLVCFDCQREPYLYVKTCLV